MNVNSKIYVAGHTGLVGSNIFNKLKQLGYKNIITANLNDLDLRNQQDTENFFKINKPEYVFLAAARVGGILANSTYKAEFIYDNLMISTNIIHASYKYGVKKLINLGSSCIYPKLALQPLKEEYLLSGYLESTNEPYAIAKIAAIKLCRYYNEQYGTNFISVMPTNLYGPNDNFNLETGHVLPVFIRKFYLAKLLQEKKLDIISKNLNINFKNINDISFEFSKHNIYADKVILWGTGEPYREFLHVEDLVDALIFLMQTCEYKDIGEIINIGTGQDLKISELANMVKEIVGFAGQIFFDNLRPDGTPRKLLDVSRIKKLGWKPKIILKEGIVKVYEKYKTFDK
ncbi:GDP-L-fucose synthase [Candidatus Dependentiae bacterium]|nr:GDP-L-fucose synthase [Candidatus Dependentiae bacterium]MBU4387301.1 GDP-L-fucose synthase [Candidatus Dependentiae bacterium]MCG2756441.1 GDP-L-fucose synthase [Candidatus Dependentiae bacterium]